MNPGRRGVTNLAAVVLLCACSCSDSFLRGLTETAEPNDGGACAPNGRVLEFTAEALEQWVALSWTTDATDAETILIERADAGATLNFGELTRVGPETGSFNDLGVERGSQYVYRAFTVRRDATGECQSLPSEELTVTVFPRAPEAIGASLVTGGVELRWLDTNGFEDGYRLERATATTGFQPVTTVAADEEIGVDGSAPEGAELRYRVVAFNGAGATPSVPVLITTAFGPSLYWDGDPFLDAACGLVVPGGADFDATFGAQFLSSTGSVSSGEGTTADEGGFTSAPLSLSAGMVDVSVDWTVTDTLGGDSTMQRSIRIETAQSTRMVQRPPTASLGDDAVDGRQAIRPLCSNCSGSPGLIEAGGFLTCALNAMGEISCWGLDEGDYRLGRGDPDEDTFVPNPGCRDARCTQTLELVELKTNNMSDSLAGDYFCGRTSADEALCWGENSWGQLGNGETVDRTNPVNVCLTGTLTTCVPLVGVRELALGQRSACARTNDSGVWCWGYNGSSQLGNGTDVDAVNPTQVCETGTWDGVSCAGGAPLQGVVSIVGGAQHFCALLDSGEARCWGANFNGQLGDGNTSGEEANPVVVGAPLTNILELTAGGAHTCARVQGDTVKCWGYQNYGQLGTGNNSGERPDPLDVCITGTAGTDCVVFDDVRQIDAGYELTCAVRGIAGEAWCWGRQNDGALGNGFDTSWSNNPTQVCVSGQWDGASCPGGALTGVRRIDVAPKGACAIIAGSEEAFCWGDAQAGSVGSGDEQDVSNPTAVCASGSGPSCMPLAGAAFIRRSRGTSCAVMADTGETMCWGRDVPDSVFFGQGFPLPVCEAGRGRTCDPMESVSTFSMGGSHGCVVRDDSSVWCWGRDNWGQLGRGDYWAGSTLPERVCATGTGVGCNPLTGAASVSAGGGMTYFDGYIMFAHSCAVMQDGTARCWGDNRHGQLGNGDQDFLARDCFTPGEDCTDVDSGAFCDGLSCAIQQNGNPTPQIVSCGETSANCVDSVLRNVVSVATGWGHTCALVEGGDLYCWGRNAEGQVGVGDNLDRLFATRTGLTGVRSITAGRWHTCAVLEDETVRCWGANGGGYLGIGSEGGARSVPGTVCLSGSGPSCVPLTGIASVSAGMRHTCALTTTGGVYCWGYGGASGFNIRGGTLGNGRGEEAVISPNPVRACAPDPNNACGGVYVCSEFLQGAVSITSGATHSCALLEDGTATCWGDGISGQIGTGRGVDRSCTPTQGICPDAFLCDGVGEVSDFALRTCDVSTVVAP